MRKGFFYIADSEIKANGYTDGKTWNGWECPWFDMENSIILMDSVNADDCTDCVVVFDAENDCFIEYEDASFDDDCAFRYYGKDIDGKHLYPFGDGYVWQEAA